ncbi:hypothetical protein L1O03_04610 [Corynebacterium uropygiale]|uniref:Uncharacterized protein n=1 Tax=Corynebacterium uropygiale TaxID=1775911 RepID=A0A9X1QSY6_9CORY|nr:hypothetical protein [Corynebacterium uropygiale]MCF4006465.1 hypothetical protein [Corynebacterium uropygiale]
MRVLKIVLIGALIVCCLALLSVVELTVLGLCIIIPLVGIAYFIFRQDPDTAESDSLRQSIHASAQDIRDLLAEYDTFLYSADADHLADRTLYRPALADDDCRIPAIRTFFQQAERSRRFLTRLEGQLSGKHNLSYLERLLSMTDHRYQELRTAWDNARQVARLHGASY